jgi:hypothetical protein
MKQQLYKLKSGKYLRKVPWDQMWHLLEKKPQRDPFSDTPMIPWMRISPQSACGHLSNQRN